MTARSRRSSGTLLLVVSAVLMAMLIGASLARDKTVGEPLSISEPKPVFLRLSPERRLIKTVEPKTAPVENGQVILDVDVGAFDLIDVDVDATSPSAYYMHFYYWTKDGVDLPITDSYYSLRLANDPGGKGRRFVNRFEALPVNRRADKLHRMILPRAWPDMRLHGFAFFGRTLIDDPAAALDGFRIEGELGRDVLALPKSGKIDVLFAEREDQASDAKVAARGIELQIGNLKAIYQIGLDHRPKKLPPGPTRIGKFAPQTLILVDDAGSIRTLGAHGADLIEVDLAEGSAVVTIYDYHFRERTHFFKERRISEDGVRMNINAGMTHRLPARALTVFQRKGAEVAFLSRHADGRLATLTIGEHADHVIVANDPLIMFGHDDGEVRVDGMGFIGNDVPITRTVFGTGGNGKMPSIRQRQKVWQDKQTPRVAEEVPSLEFSAELRRLFDLYLAVGADVEYGPHASAMSRGDVPDETKTRETMIRALRQVERYRPRVSIDHGGLEVMHVFGWNREDAKYHTFDLLLDAGIEHIYAFADKLSGDHTMLFPDQASNVFYQLPSIADVPEDRAEPYFFAQSQMTWDETFFSLDQLEAMVERRGFLNLHTYLGNDVTLPVFDDAGAFHGAYSLVPWFNRHLRNIDAMRDRGDLWLGLNSELYDFQRGLDGLSFSWTEDCIDVDSARGEAIEGVTLAVARFEDGKWSAETPVATPPDGMTGMRNEDRIDYLWFAMMPNGSKHFCLGGNPLT